MTPNTSWGRRGGDAASAVGAGSADVPASGGVSTGPGCWRPKITERFPLSLETGVWLVDGVVGMTSLAGMLAGAGTAGRCGDPVVDADDPATPSPRAKEPSAATMTVTVLVRDFFDIRTGRPG